jgi:hypothetical protein
LAKSSKQKFHPGNPPARFFVSKVSNKNDEKGAPGGRKSRGGYRIQVKRTIEHIACKFNGFISRRRLAKNYVLKKFAEKLREKTTFKDFVENHLSHDDSCSYFF